MYVYICVVNDRCNVKEVLPRHTPAPQPDDIRSVATRGGSGKLPWAHNQHTVKLMFVQKSTLYGPHPPQILRTASKRRRNNSKRFERR